jgi:transcription elongation GreA/GreB family factor
VLATEAEAAREAAAAAEQRFQELEAALAKVQVLAENAEQTAKAAVASQSKLAKKVTAATTKKVTAATTKKATSPRSPKTTSSAKKPAGTPAE